MNRWGLCVHRKKRSLTITCWILHLVCTAWAAACCLWWHRMRSGAELSVGHQPFGHHRITVLTRVRDLQSPTVTDQEGEAKANGRTRRNLLCLAKGSKQQHYKTSFHWNTSFLVFSGDCCLVSCFSVRSPSPILHTASKPHVVVGQGLKQLRLKSMLMH